MDRRRIKEKIISHIRETPKEVLYVELVEAGMERNKEFEDKHNITITKDSIMEPEISNVKKNAQSEEPRFIKKLSEIDETLNDIQYELGNLENKLEPYSSPLTDSEEEGAHGEFGKPDSSKMDSALDNTLRKTTQLLNRVYNIQDRFNG